MVVAHSISLNLGKQETGRAWTHLFSGILLWAFLRGPKALIKLLQIMKWVHIDYTITHKSLGNYGFESLILAPDIDELPIFLPEFLL